MKNQNIFYPFAGPKDFILGRYFVKNHIAQTAVNEYFNSGLAKTPVVASSSKLRESLRDTASSDNITFKSWHDLNKKMTELAEETSTANVEWQRGTVRYGALSRNKDKAVEYFYRDVQESVQFLLEQPCFEPHLTYKPVRDFDDTGARCYGELNTGDWWWRQQVGKEAHSHRQL